MGKGRRIRRDRQFQFIRGYTGEKMKRKVTALICAAVMVLSAAPCSFAGVVTQKEIDEGLKACAEYPVSLYVDGKQLVFRDNEVPPTIITLAGEQNGRTLVPARTMFEAAGATVDWNDEWREVTVKYNDMVVVVKIDSDIAAVNGEQVKLDVPALIIDHDGDGFGSTMLPVRFVSESLKFGVKWDGEARSINISVPEKIVPAVTTGSAVSGGAVASGSALTSGGALSSEPAIVANPFATYPAIYVPATKITSTAIYAGTKFPDDYDATIPAISGLAATKLIVIDAGHGGSDVGAIGHEDQFDETHEKDINLAVALRVCELLKEAGARVECTRTDDTAVALYDRPAIANASGAALFVSIHNNSNPNSMPNGTEVHYYNKIDEQGNDVNAKYGLSCQLLARTVEYEMCRALGTAQRGIYSSPKLAVLRRSEMPAIIVEGAFMSNDMDLAKIRSVEFTERYASAVAKAIVITMNGSYLRERENAENDRT